MSITKENIFSVLPDDLVEKSSQMATAYEYIFCLENLLRQFLNNHKHRNEFTLSKALVEKIQGRKNKEQSNKWISIRGSEDIFYLDLKDVSKIISQNWNYLKNDFPDLEWITSKINDLVKFRNLIAHNSFINKDDFLLIRAYFNTIVKQLDFLEINQIAEVKNSLSSQEDSFIIGLKNSVVFTKEEAENGIAHKLEYTELAVSPLAIRIQFIQVGILFYIQYKTYAIRIEPQFSVGTISKQDFFDYKSKIKFQIGQYDIDNDGIDELFICIQDNDRDIFEGGVEINVFKYYPPAYEEHSFRVSNWELVGKDILGKAIFGEPKAYVENNSISIPRNHRGFFAEWTWVKDKFVVTNEY